MRAVSEARGAAAGPPMQAAKLWLRRYGSHVALILLLLFNFAVTPHFVSWQTLNVNLTQVATIVIGNPLIADASVQAGGGTCPAFPIP